MAAMPSPKKRRKKWLWLILVLAVLGVGAYSFLSAGSEAAQALFTEEAVQNRDIVTYYSFSGNLTPITDEIQTAKESLKVKEIYVTEGQTVQQGDALLRGTDGTRIFAAHAGTIESCMPKRMIPFSPAAKSPALWITQRWK